MTDDSIKGLREKIVKIVYGDTAPTKYLLEVHENIPDQLVALIQKAVIEARLDELEMIPQTRWTRHRIIDLNTKIPIPTSIETER